MSRLFVGNLPFRATEAELNEWFTQAGASVDSVTVMRDKFTGEARGFGFAEVRDEDHARRVIEACNGREFMGRAIVVNEARPMSDRAPRAGGGGGGGRREFSERGGRGGGRNRW